MSFVSHFPLLYEHNGNYDTCERMLSCNLGSCNRKHLQFIDMRIFGHSEKRTKRKYLNACHNHILGKTSKKTLNFLVFYQNILLQYKSYNYRGCVLVHFESLRNCSQKFRGILFLFSLSTIFIYEYNVFE